MDFAAQYQQAPILPGGNDTKWQWFKFFDELPSFQHGDRVLLSWDTAQSPSELADYSVGMTLPSVARRFSFSMWFVSASNTPL